MGCLVCTKLPNVDGRKLYDACQISDGQLCLPCRQYMEVEAQVLALKESLAAASMRKIELRTQMNIQHDSITHRLPPEILSAIFESYTDIDTGARRPFLDDEGGVDFENYMFTPSIVTFDKSISWCSPLTLGAVCHTWRHIAWTSPELWTKISIGLTRPKDWNSIEIAQECLSRSAGLPLSIRLVCEFPRQGRQKDDEKEFVRLISMINQQSRGWVDLHLSCQRELIPLIVGDLKGTTLLRHIIRSQSLNPIRRGGSDPFGFRIIGIKPCGIKSLDIDWSHVTKVQFAASTWVYLDNCIELLRHSSHLVDLQISHFGDVDKYQFPSPGSPMALKLQNLLIGNYKGDKLGLFLGVFVFPHLTHLTLGVIDKIALSYFADMIRRSSCHIISLRLYCISYTLETLLELVRETPFLRELKISYYGINQLVDFYRLLANTSTSDIADSFREPLLPNLQYIHYHTHDVEYALWHNSVWSLLPNMLGTLHKIKSTSVIPTIGYYELDQLICKDRNVLMRVVELLDSGMKLTLKHNKKDLLEMSMRHHGITRTRRQAGDSHQMAVSPG